MHLLWQILDEKHPDYNPEVIRNFENTFLELYSTIDSWISKFMESIPDATFLIFSLSGMEPNYSGWHLLPEVLQRMGMIGDAPKSTNGGFGSRIFKNFEWLMPTKKWGTHKIRKLEDSLSH